MVEGEEERAGRLARVRWSSEAKERLEEVGGPRARGQCGFLIVDQMALRSRFDPGVFPLGLDRTLALLPRQNWRVIFIQQAQLLATLRICILQDLD